LPFNEKLGHVQCNIFYGHLITHFNKQENDVLVPSKCKHCQKCILHVRDMREHLKEDHNCKSRQITELVENENDDDDDDENENIECSNEKKKDIKKLVESKNIEAHPISAKCDTKPSRGRGRPPIKRPVGRPPKNLLQLGTVKPKHVGRGRPSLKKKANLTSKKTETENKETLSSKKRSNSQENLNVNLNEETSSIQKRRSINQSRKIQNDLTQNNNTFLNDDDDDDQYEFIDEDFNNLDNIYGSSSKDNKANLDEKIKSTEKKENDKIEKDMAEMPVDPIVQQRKKPGL
jgi:hypothetical protein